MLWHLSSQGTDSSTLIWRFVAVDWMTMTVNCSFLSWFAWSVTSLAWCRMSCFFVLLFVKIWCAFFDKMDGGDDCVFIGLLFKKVVNENNKLKLTNTCTLSVILEQFPSPLGNLWCFILYFFFLFQFQIIYPFKPAVLC